MKTPTALLVLVALMVSCQTFAPPPVSPALDQFTLAGSKALVFFEDFPKTRWPDVPATLFISVWISDDVGLFTEDNVVEIVLTDPHGQNWNIKPDKYGNKLGGWWRFWCTSYSVDGSVFALGQYTFDIETKDGKTFRKKIDMTKLMDARGRPQFIYSADYDGKKNRQYVSCLTRPTIETARFTGSDNDTLEVAFSVRDEKVKSVFLEFYNKEGKVVAWSRKLVNLFSEQTDPALNEGTTLKTNGDRNLVKLPQSQLSFYEVDHTIDSVSVCAINGTNRDDYLSEDGMALLAASLPATMSEDE